MDRRSLLAAMGVAGLGAAAGWGRAETGDGVPRLYRVAEPEALMAATRSLMAEDRIGTLITVDGEGQPRARSVVVSKPDADLMLWMGTRPGSRKLEQIAAHPAVTLHFAVDSKAEYASLMGEARVYKDAAMIAAKNPFTGKSLAEYFPHFPEDFVLIGFKPKWLEVVTDHLLPNAVTWQPQGMLVK